MRLRNILRIPQPMAAFVIFLIRFNQVDTAGLTAADGRTFERAKVLEVLKDNVQEHGTMVNTLILLPLLLLQKNRQGQKIRDDIGTEALK